METVGMENLSSAAAQGEQAFEPHHANGYNFTGADPNVRTLEDAVRQLKLLVGKKMHTRTHSNTLEHIRLPW